MSAPYVDQSQLKIDANVFLPWALEQMNNPFNLMPDSVKIVLERWIPVVQGLTDSDQLRQSIVTWVNENSGAVPPT